MLYTLGLSWCGSSEVGRRGSAFCIAAHRVVRALIQRWKAQPLLLHLMRSSKQNRTEHNRIGRQIGTNQEPLKLSKSESSVRDEFVKLFIIANMAKLVKFSRFHLVVSLQQAAVGWCKLLPPSLLLLIFHITQCSGIPVLSCPVVLLCSQRQTRCLNWTCFGWLAG